MIGEIISYYRRKGKITQETLSKGICSISYLSKIENNQIEATETILDLLCRRLNISLNHVIEENTIIENTFKEWHTNLLSREMERADEKRSKLKGVNPEYKNLEYYKRFSLYNFAHYLFEKKLNLAKQELDQLIQYSNLFSSEQSYEYHQFVGLYYYYLNDFQLSLDYLKKSEKIGEQYNIIRPELYYHIALTMTRMYQIFHSISYAKKALVIFDQDSNYLRSTDCKILLGINSIRLKNFQDAESYLTSALKVAKTYGSQHLEAIILHNMGYLQSILQNHEKALSFFHESISLRVTDENKTRLVNTIYFLSKEYNTVGDLNSALHWCQEGLGISQKLNLCLYKIKFTTLYFTILFQNDSEELGNYLENEAIPYLIEVSDYYHLNKYAEMLSKMYARKFIYKKANFFMELAYDSLKKMTGVVIDL